MLERWRPETHTFHLPTGECTITLEDVSMLLGLRVNGKAANGPTQVGGDVYMEHLGVEPTTSDKHKGYVKIVWLQTTLARLRQKARPTDKENLQHAKIYILLLIAKVLMPDKSHNYMHSSWIPLVGDLDKCRRYSWGSACLATLYRHMCKACMVGVKSIGGCVLLLSVWTYWRIPLIAPESPATAHHPYATRFVRRGMAYQNNPRHYVRGFRFALDRLRANDFIWRPYPSYPECVLQDSQIWSATTSIISFHIVEMHQADRVKLQFGFQQDIPPQPRCLRQQHETDMPNTWGDHWRNINKEENNEWRNRTNLTLRGNMVNGNCVHSAEYMQWFLSIPFMHASQGQFLEDPRQYATSSSQQRSSSPMPQEMPQVNPSQFETQTSSFNQPTFFAASSQQPTQPQPQPTYQRTHTTFFATSSQQPTPYTPTPQPNYYYRQQYQEQATFQPSFQFTPIPQPNFDFSYPQPQHQTFNPSMSHPSSSGRTDNVYYPPIQQNPPTTFTQPFQSAPNFTLTDDQLMEWPGFSVTDVDMLDTSRQPENEELTSDSTPSPPTSPPIRQTQELGRGKRVKKSTLCGTGGHLRR
ncbi:unnamed protein product [Lathyrus sativus]|nr:unnamed protein product [Lathyrus sativus]